MKKSYKLPKEFAAKWVAALRSGDYQQSTGELTIGRDNEKVFAYCCLGVACKVVGIKDNSLHAFSSLHEMPIFIDAGIPKELLDTELELHFIEMNDKEGKTFNEIADWIEKEIEFI